MPRGVTLLALLALVLAWLPAVGGPAELLAAAALVAVLLLIRQPSDGSAPRIRSLSLRSRAERLAFLRTRDPDADGRVRPRAPGQRVAAG